MKFIRPALLALSVFGPAVASAAVSIGIGIGIGTGSGCTNTICSAGALILYVINDIMIPVLFAIAFIVFLWGVAKAYIFNGADEAERAKGHQLVLWGIIGFVVMISLWGLVNIAANTFGLAGDLAPRPPRSDVTY